MPRALTLLMRDPTVVAMPLPPPLLSASSSSGTATEAEADCSTVRSKSAGHSTRSLLGTACRGGGERQQAQKLLVPCARHGRDTPDKYKHAACPRLSRAPRSLTPPVPLTSAEAAPQLPQRVLMITQS